MVFSSPIFIFLFLPVFLLVYYMLPLRFRSWHILIGSYFFYAWWRVDFLGILIGVTLWNYWIGGCIAHQQTRLEANSLIKAKRYLYLGVIGNLGTLGYFKYFNFGLQSWNDLMHLFGGDEWQGWNVILPIGISFFVFQSISYLIDVYRKDARPADNVVHFAAFVALFPQLIAGPVLRYKDLEQQFYSRVHNQQKFLEGLRRFTFGLAKKVIIADSVGKIADSVFSLSEPTMMEAWLGVIAYTVQLYFDFSGYSSMAIGLGLMMGFRFIENFNAPYTSKSITEFWQRWHISLSTWLRDYLYIPLGGNKHGTLKTYRNLVLTMLLGGIWHGAGWTFLAWGAWHGGILALERSLKSWGLPYRLPGIFGMILTMILVMIGWTFFRASDLSNALGMLHSMLGLNGFALGDAFVWQISNLSILCLIAGIIAIYLENYLSSFSRFGQLVHQQWFAIPAYGAVILLVAAKLSADSYSPFLYFQF